MDDRERGYAALIELMFKERADLNSSVCELEDKARDMESWSDDELIQAQRELCWKAEQTQAFRRRLEDPIQAESQEGSVLQEFVSLLISAEGWVSEPILALLEEFMKAFATRVLAKDGEIARLKDELARARLMLKQARDRRVSLKLVDEEEE